ncbi:MAG: hypothetical protein WC766_06105 [Patescibacteria group bacterium]
MNRESMFASLCAIGLCLFSCSSPASGDADDPLIEPDRERVEVDRDQRTINVSVQEIHADNASQAARPAHADSASYDKISAAKGEIAKVANGYGSVFIPQDEIPTGLMFATCMSNPWEVAVPLNPTDDRYCDTVQAFAYRDDDGDVYDVSADYVWSIADTSIAQIHPLPGKEHDNVQRPSAMYDIFWADDQSHEPSTSVTVCAVPKGGGNWPGNQQICDTLPLNVVVNLEGSWCFSGATFNGDCDSVTLDQDGRVFGLGQNGKGYVDTKEISFLIGGNFYLGDILNRDSISGIVVNADTQQYIGTWQAWHLPLY